MTAYYGVCPLLDAPDDAGLFVVVESMAAIGRQKAPYKGGARYIFRFQGQGSSLVAQPSGLSVQISRHAFECLSTRRPSVGGEDVAVAIEACGLLYARIATVRPLGALSPHWRM